MQVPAARSDCILKNVGQGILVSDEELSDAVSAAVSSSGKAELNVGRLHSHITSYESHFTFSVSRLLNFYITVSLCFFLIKISQDASLASEAIISSYSLYPRSINISSASSSIPFFSTWRRVSSLTPNVLRKPIIVGVADVIFPGHDRILGTSMPLKKSQYSTHLSWDANPHVTIYRH